MIWAQAAIGRVRLKIPHTDGRLRWNGGSIATNGPVRVEKDGALGWNGPTENGDGRLHHRAAALAPISRGLFETQAHSDFTAEAEEQRTQRLMP